MKHKNDDTYIILPYSNNRQYRDTKPYLITICKHQVKDYVSPEELNEVISALASEGIVVQYGCIERHGKYKQLHYHGVVNLPKTMRYGLYTQYDDFRIHYQWIQSHIVTKRYIFKHYSPYTHTEQDTVMANYFAYHYAF